ncbi:hypothetical protein [Haloferula helveola]|uniref:hypothetical protein n=2 Tax=Haloferula helveola TaxID=490095 RepID=UPI003340958F
MITVTLMVLLALLAVGLLSLSTISLRASSQGDAMQQAQANARLGLTLAIGEIQKRLGDDRRITAPATFEDPNAPAHLAGVWEGVPQNVEQPSAEAADRFLGYISSGIEENPRALPAKDGIPLLDEGSLGPNPDPEDIVLAPTVDMAIGGNRTDGRFAWTAFDESLKAKADLVREEPRLPIASQALLGAAPRFGMEQFPEVESFNWSRETSQNKLVSLQSSDLLPGLAELGDLQHDVTVFSHGVISDPGNGGLKRDLSRIADDLPSDMRREPIYDDRSLVRAENNPLWSHLADYASLYKETIRSSNGGYEIEAAAPRDGEPRLNRRDNAYTDPQTPSETPLTPVVSKVELQFTLIAKDAHGHWPGTIRNKTGDSRRTYMLYLIYTPIVTLYNPYNVPIETQGMRIDFADVPIGFRFYRGDSQRALQPQTTDLAHFNQLYLYHDSNSSTAKAFGLNVRGAYGSGSSSVPIRLLPGESKVFGESVDGNWSWNNNGGVFDWADRDGKGLTADVTLGPGYARGMGFWVDWLTPDHMLTAYDDGMGIYSMRSTDFIDVEFAPMPSQASGNKLSIDVSLVTTDRRRETTTRVGTYFLSFNDRRDPAGLLTKAMSTGQERVRYPARLQRPYRTTEIYQSPADRIKDYSRVKPFATFSFEAKTTLDAKTPSKPWVQGAQASNMSVIRLESEKADHATHDVAMRQIGPNDEYPWDPLTDRAFFFTAKDADMGITSAPQFEIPALPLQSPAQLRHARLAPQGFLGSPNYTVGESWASPLMPPNRVTYDAGQGYELLDHSWLLNSKLWDGYFFSTICQHGGAAMDSRRGAADVAKGFFDGSERLLNSRLISYTDRPTEELVADVVDETGYLHTAAHLMIDGPFNVNTLSIDAWKTLLASLNEEDVTYYDGTGGPAGIGEEDTISRADNPLSRMRRPTGRPVEDSIGAPPEVAREGRWKGFRTLDDDQIERLAEEIVDEVRERGPFLSLADFVNRRVGNDKDLALKGALQAAIDRTDINAEFDEDSIIYGAAETADSDFPFEEAMHGPSATGAPGFLTQGDILSTVGQVMTVRSDTFRIRSYGEAVDSSGRVSARAWCEAVIQRTPDYLDPTDEAFDEPTTAANETFGRRFVVTAFRWLAPEEV